MKSKILAVVFCLQCNAEAQVFSVNLFCRHHQFHTHFGNSQQLLHYCSAKEFVETTIIENVSFAVWSEWKMRINFDHLAKCFRFQIDLPKLYGSYCHNALQFEGSSKIGWVISSLFSIKIIFTLLFFNAISISPKYSPSWRWHNSLPFAVVTQTRININKAIPLKMRET